MAKHQGAHRLARSDAFSPNMPFSDLVRAVAPIPDDTQLEFVES